MQGSLGFWGDSFDFNGDGKLDIFEEAWIERTDKEIIYEKLIAKTL